jgi:hypothetical protein
MAISSSSGVIPSGRAGAGDSTAVTGSNGSIRLTAAVLVPAPLHRRCSDSLRGLELLQGIEELDGMLR